MSFRGNIKKAFPIKLIDSCIKNFSQEKTDQETSHINSWKKDLVIVLLFLGLLSYDLRTHVKNSISKNSPFGKIRVIFKSSTHISNFFQFKDKMPYCLCSNIIHKFSCGGWNATYYNKTGQHLSIRVGKHSFVSPSTGKKSKSRNSTTIKYHMLFCDHILFIDDFKILATSYSDFHVKFKESLLISTGEPILNKKWNVTTSSPIWMVHSIRNYILMIFIIVAIIVLM